VEEQIQDSLEITCAYKEAYLNELITYQLYFDGYTYDQINGKMAEVPVIIFYKFSFVQAAIVVTSFQNEHVVTTTKKPKPIRGKTKLAIVSCTSSLPMNLWKYLL
jgi:hypothetical protein